MLGFRVINVDTSNLPGVPATATVAFGELWLTVRCQQEDVDPPEYTRLKRIAAEQAVSDLEARQVALEDTWAWLESQLETLRPVADPLGEHRQRVLRAVRKKMGKKARE